MRWRPYSSAAGWDAERCARLKLAAAMHDMGKLGIPQAILRKPGPLDETEWDGSGYPDGLRGEELPQSARFVALADVFDALSMCRPYKPGWPIDDSIGHLKAGAGSHFEPRLAQLFVELMPQLLTIREQFHDVETVT